MRVLNVHRRRLDAAVAAVAPLIDSLASRHDLLWPREHWPAMRLEGGLREGARGGHGPIRYTVERLEPGRLARFRFTGPAGFDGTHAFEVVPAVPGACELVHTIDMAARGTAVLTWTLVLRPLHDALIEDALDRASAFTGSPAAPARWSAWVRVLRRLMGAGRRG